MVVYGASQILAPLGAMWTKPIAIYNILDQEALGLI